MIRPGPATLDLRRPGGFALTDRALAFCAFPPGSRILDVGCGSGATVRHLRDRHGLEAFGLDADPGPGGPPGWVVRARAEALPWAAGTLDGVFLECSLSVLEDPDRALAECRRVLRPGGRLVVADVLARGVPARLGGCLGAVETRADLEARIRRPGFSVERFEDHSGALRALWGQMILDRGLPALCAELGADPARLRAVRCGYGLFVARGPLP